MRYQYSQQDNSNLKWFKNDMSRATLISIQLAKGNLRGLTPFKIYMEYPITVIAGKNCAGKSTILAIAACAFHNKKNGYKLLTRKLPYYTFSDFFVQAPEDKSPDGIVIYYNIAYNNWKKSPSLPTGIGVGNQTRRKKAGGKWNDYDLRVMRNVVYYGIERIVPHYERSVSKTYRGSFKITSDKEWVSNVYRTVGRILNKTYSHFELKEHTKYSLPVVETTGIKYSGLNMGAGENAMFEIFSTIYASPPGILLVIDEIELGLHEEAQRIFIDELKKICNERKVQIICTTHSPMILSSVPPEARFFVENINGNTKITKNISAKHSASKMSGLNGEELKIFVEDTIAKVLVETSLKSDIRTRVKILPIGSDNAVIRQMASSYKDSDKCEYLVILDGDKRTQAKSKAKDFVNYLENCRDIEVASKWFNERIAFIPGKCWPEKWLLESIRDNCIHESAKQFKIDEEILKDYLCSALMANKHNEISDLAIRLNLDYESVKSTLANIITTNKSGDFEDINKHIIALLF